MKTLAVLSTTLIVASVAASTAPAMEPPPTLVLTTASVNYAAARATVKLNFCLSVGPRAVILSEEVRRVGTRVVARRQARDPLGVDLDEVYPRECVRGYTIAWLVSRALVGPGSYTVTFRVRDGYGVVSKPVSITMAAGL